MKLSVLICTIPSRVELLKRLRTVLDPQVEEFKSDVEVLVNLDDGTKSIGKKRNELLDQATGDYVAFIDDDDLVSEQYIKLIMEAIKDKPDCVGINGLVTFSNKVTRPFIHSILYPQWFTKDKVYYRCPNHLNPMQRRHALAVRFPEKNFGEDCDFSMAVRPLLVSECFISESVYHYFSRGGAYD